MRRAPLSLLLVGLLAVASAAAEGSVAGDVAASSVVERRWPGAWGRIEKDLAERPEPSTEARAAVGAAVLSAAEFAEAEGGTESAGEAALHFRAALDALGPARPRFLGNSGGLAEIARSILGDAELHARLAAPDKTGFDSARDAELHRAGARALETFYKGRFEEDRPRSDAGSFASVEARGRRRVRTTAAPRGRSAGELSERRAASTAGADGLAARSLILELREAALAALQAAARAVVLPASALASAMDRLTMPVRRDVKLIAASRAAVEWLSRTRDARAPGLLQSFLRAARLPDAARRAALADALSGTRTLMSVSNEGAENALLRRALAAAGSNYVRFVQARLGDFPAGTRFADWELGLSPPSGSGAASVVYEITSDGRLTAARVTALDGSTRERGEAFGTWTIRDESGRTTGWSLDADALSAMADAEERSGAVAAAARWLTAQGFRPDGREGLADSLASLLGDALSRPRTGAKTVQVYADREKGLLHIDSSYEHGLRQAVARYEPSTGGAAAGLAVFERTTADPNDSSRPWHETMAYRGTSERDLMTEKIVSNGGSMRRIVTGTRVESVPVAVRYARGEDGRWERDGSSRELREQRRTIHASAGVIGGAGEVLVATGRGATDLAGAVAAASMALDLFPERVLLNEKEASALQADWFARAKANFADNAFLSTAGAYYAPGAYRDFKAALNVDDRKYIQNVRKELTDQGHPLLGALAGAGIDVADGMVPMAAGLGAINAISPLGLAGQAAATGVNYFWTGQALWSAGVSVKDFARARRRYDERDPAAVEDYYGAVENLASQSAGAPLMLAGLREATAAEGGPRPERAGGIGEGGGSDRVALEDASIRTIGREPLDSRPELLGDLSLRKLYEYSLKRREAVAARVHEISRRCGLIDSPEIVSLIKGQEPHGTLPGAFENFRAGVLEKMGRKGYRSLNKMTDMARGRISLQDFEAVRKFTLETLKTESIADVSYPSGTPPEFVAELRRLVGEAKVKEHKAANKNNARIHIDLLDPETNFVYELQVGTKHFNDLMQDPLVRVPPPLVQIFAKVDPYGIREGRANFHLVYYDGVKALLVKHPEIAGLPETRRFVEKITEASRDSGGVDGMKPVDVAMLTHSAEHLLDALYQRDPNIFNDLGHGQ